MEKTVSVINSESILRTAAPCNEKQKDISSVEGDISDVTELQQSVNEDH